MSTAYSFTLEEREDYLHIVVRGKNDAATIRRYIKDTLAASIAHSCPNILVEENLDGPRLGMGEVFQIVAEASASARHDVHRIAFVDVHAARSLSNMKFAETVALNRGMMMNVFSTVADAEQWLRSKLAPRAPKAKRKPKGDGPG
jgi:hypothetical protein